VWKNVVHLAILIEELSLSSHDKQKVSQSFSPFEDVNSGLLNWVSKDYLLYSFGSNEKLLWQEWEVTESLFKILDLVFPPSLLPSQTSPQAIEKTVFALLEKSSADEFAADVELLMHEGQFGASSSSEKKSPSSGNLNILPENTFMKAILNMACLAITQADTKELLCTWLDRLERFIKFVIVISETWKSRHLQHYNGIQKKFAETVSYAFTFLFREIHKGQGSSSPKEMNKLCSQTLKNLFVFLLNVGQFSKIKFTPNELQAQVHVPACRIILNSILIKYQSEPLITVKDMSRYKNGDYEDFPETFYLDDWKVTFFSNEGLNDIIRRQLSSLDLEQFLQKRLLYARNSYEVQLRTDRTKEDILRKMNGEIGDIVKGFNEVESIRQVKMAVLNENFQRE